MKKTLALLALLFTIFSLNGQTKPQLEWDKTYGEKKNDIGYSIIEMPNHGFAISASQSKGFGAYLWLMKTDDRGNITTEKIYKNIYEPLFIKLLPSKDNGFITTGINSSAEAEGKNFLLFKTDGNFSSKWQKQFHGREEDYTTNIIETSDGGYLLIGNSAYGESFNSKATIVKTDANGNKQWQKEYGNNFKNIINCVIETPDKGFIIAGGRTFEDMGFEDVWIFKINSKGDVVWEQNNGGGGTDIASDIIATKDGGYLVLANTSSKGAGWIDIWVLKIDETGKILWDKTYGGSQNDDAYNIIQDNENSYIIAGSTKSKGVSDWDYWIIDIDKDGNIIWDETFGGMYEDKAFSITKTFDGGFAVLGYTESKGAGKKDIWLVKLRFSVRDRATSYVQNAIFLWEAKGKYEKIEDYKIRVNESTRQQKIYELMDEFFGQIGIPIFQNDVKTTTLDYDSESEIFRFNLTYYNSIYLPVPIEEAEIFEKNLGKLVYSSIKFNLTQDDKLEIYQMTIKNPANGKTYFFDASKPVIFNDQVIVNEFDPIVIGPNHEEDGNDNQDNNNIDVDVDNNIPNSGKNYSNHYALIIGNSNYIKHGSDMVDIKYSINDAKIFKQYAINILGVPDDNNHIYYIEDANATYIKIYIDNFAKLIKAKSDGEFYVYYSGHGTQNEEGEAFIVPVGVTSDYINDFGVKLSDFYAQINPEGDKKVIVFLDACFSGGGKTGQLLINAKTGLKRTPNDANIGGNLLVFAASSEKQISQEYLEKRHGLFTYFLFKNLKDTKGNISYGELATKIIDDVTTTALNPQNGLKEQSPTINVSPAIQNTWKNWKVNP
ncbi:MAG: caspase family protein [Bacteroidales bacterium]|nr:caspase family protein [Bacteroidales bacterium]